MQGLILIDKPAGMTSHDVIDELRKITGVKKIGHAGTLDPFATGLLLIAIGPYTKKLKHYVGLDKSYEARAKLGEVSETYDPEGRKTLVVKEQPAWLTQEKIEQALVNFRGGYRQKAPVYSAKKVRGKKLYDLARKGEAKESERPEKDVMISSLVMKRFDWPYFDLDITCGSGTYIRSLVHDIGEKLTVGAYTESLRRTSVGPFSVKNALLLEDLTKEQVERALILDSTEGG